MGDALRMRGSSASLAPLRTRVLSVPADPPDSPGTPSIFMASAGDAEQVVRRFVLAALAEVRGALRDEASGTPRTLTGSLTRAELEGESLDLCLQLLSRR